MHRQMAYFTTVVELNSFHKAAQACRISQSAISQQISALENELQVVLFERRGRRFSITPAGEYFYKMAKNQTAELDSIINEVRRIDKDERVRLCLGVQNGLGGLSLLKTVQGFTGSHPQVKLSMLTDAREGLLSQLANGSVDMVICDRRDEDKWQFVCEELAEQPLYALIKRNTGLIGAQSISVDELEYEACILVSPATYRKAEAEYWRNAARLKSGFLFVESADAAKLNAAAGLGYYLCGSENGNVEGTLLLPVTLDNCPLKRKICAYWMAESADTSLQQELMQALKKAAV